MKKSPKGSPKHGRQSRSDRFSTVDSPTMTVKLKRIILPLHKTFKRFVLVVGFGVLLFVLYTYIINNYISKYRLQSLRLYYHWEESQSSELPINSNVTVIETRDRYGFEKAVVEPKPSGKKLIMLVLISSSAIGDSHRDRRESIRKTWGNCQDESIKSELQELAQSQINGRRSSNEYNGCGIVFFMGKTYEKKWDKKVIAESERYGDIIIGDIRESYWNITFKLLMGLKWAANQKPQYLLKTDDDVYVHIPKLVAYLYKNPSLPDNLYGGKVYYGHVVRNPSHRHFVLNEEFADDWYPPFCKGFMYVLSGNLLPRIVKTSTRVRRFKIDDAYIGIVLRNMGIAPVRIKQFVQFDFFTLFVEMLHYCDFSWIIGMGDSLRPPQMHYIHEQMKVVNYLPSWMCMHVDPLIVYAIVVFTISVMVFICMKSRYCPWWSPCG